VIRCLDVSALAKRYVAEPRSKDVGRLLLDGIAVTGGLSEAEIAPALARRHRGGILTRTQRDRLLSAMQQDMASLYVVELSPEVSALACRLLMRHRLRAGDALHLASALTLTGQSRLKVQFVGFDENLNEAAKQEGLELPAF
jgi:hypothetical protein